MNSIKFDTTELRNTTYIPRFVKHESSTERDLNILNLARDNGGVLVNDRRGVKIITLKGVLTGSSESALETAIDNFKELFSRVEKNLDIEWAGSTRRYVATCKSHNFDRDYFNLLFVPWTAEFIIPSGIGKDISITAEKHNITVNANPYSWTSTFSGSAKPKPIITLEFGIGHTYPRGIQLKNVTTGEKIIFNKITPLSNGDTIVIDFENKKITLEGVEQPFYGVFPDLIVGNNSLELSIGNILDQYSPNVTISASYIIAGDLESAQGIIVPSTDGSYERIGIYCSKDGSPAEALRVEIQTDNNGVPSGSLVSANAHGNINASDVGALPSWVYCYLTDNIQLEANTPYWIVVKSAGSSVGNNYNLQYTEGAFAEYSKGTVAITDDGETTWTIQASQNLGFRLYYGGASDVVLGTITLDVDYYKLYL